MTMQKIIDIDELLKPITLENPVGAKLELGTNRHYRELKNARDKARRVEKILESGSLEQKEISKGKKEIRENWLKVFELAQYVLKHDSKDLMVTVWLLEALVRLHAFHEDYSERSFAGLSEGFCLTRGLFENFWEELKQHEDQTGEKANLELINALNSESGLVKAIRMVPITAGEAPFATWQWENIKHGYDKDGYEKLAQNAGQTSSDFFLSLMNDLRKCQAELEHFTQSLSKRAGSGSVHSSGIRQVLKDVQFAVSHVCKEIAGKDLGTSFDENEHEKDQQTSDENSEIEDGETEVSKMPLKASAKDAGPIQNREDAFRRLLEIAKYFENNEPHSPISYTLKEVVRRGRLSLVELLGELVEHDSRTMFLERAGIRPPKQEDE